MKPRANITQVEGSGTALLAALVNEAETTFPGPPAWVRLKSIVAAPPENTPPVTVPEKSRPIVLTPRVITSSDVKVSVNAPKAPVHVLTMGVVKVIGPPPDPYMKLTGETVRVSPKLNPDLSPAAVETTVHVEPSRSSAVDPRACACIGNASAGRRAHRHCREVDYVYRRLRAEPPPTVAIKAAASAGTIILMVTPKEVERKDRNANVA